MHKKLSYSIGIVAVLFLLLIVASILVQSTIAASFIGKWGLLLGFALLLVALPLYKVIYFGGRGLVGSQTPEIPADEHLHQQTHRYYEKDRKPNLYQDVCTIAGILMIVISIFIV
ncbi:hypothetical protein [Aquibacillus sediminis]|uniref:hypothetical protein n=1 Tax=Aquibacillus sediminis TaxID=2574734 RepID=UPI001107C76B|nr:hypothetical protein [Aquibacillus sediminis]